IAARLLCCASAQCIFLRFQSHGHARPQLGPFEGRCLLPLFTMPRSLQISGSGRLGAARGIKQAPCRVGVFVETAVDKSLRQSAVVALLVAGALFMEQLDGTVLATALPRMAESFAVAASDLNVGMSAYLLTVAVFIPASGWMTDRFGARTVFASAIATFTVSSVLCAASGTLWEFTAARVLQGIGGAMMVPVGRLIV